MQSYGFDDEFFNIRLVEQYELQAFFVTQTTDVHPPASYLINALLYKVFGSWSAVRVLSALMTCSALIYLSENLKQREGIYSATIVFLLIALNPAVLMWGTSLRWYAYFFPVLLWVLVLPQIFGFFYWAKLVSGILFLGYTSYLSFLISPVLIFMYWIASPQNRQVKLKFLAPMLIIAFLAYLPQFDVFLNVHYPLRDGQMGSLFSSVVGLFVGQISNQGVFPLSVPGIVGAIGFILTASSVLISKTFKPVKENYNFPSYFSVICLMLLTGISSKFRNLVIAVPFQALWLGTLQTSARLKKWYHLGLFMIFIGNFWGVINVVNHRDTTKNSWNIPVEEVMEYLDIENIKCDQDTVIFVHDPVISYHLEEAYFAVVGPYSDSLVDLDREYQCAFVISTFAGVISHERYEQMIRDVDRVVSSSVEVVSFQEDPFYDFKHQLDNRYPRFSVIIKRLADVENLEVMRSWLP